MLRARGRSGSAAGAAGGAGGASGAAGARAGAPAAAGAAGAPPANSAGPPVGPDGKPLVDAESEVARQAPSVQAPTAADVSEAPPSAQIAQQGAAAVQALGQVAAKAAAPAPSAPAPHKPDPLPPPDAAAATAAEAAAPAAAAMAQRDAAMSTAAQSAAQLETVRSGAGDVASASVRYEGEGEAAAAASEMASGFLGMVGARAAEVSELGAGVPERFQAAASQTVDQIGAAVAERSQAIAGQIAQHRADVQAHANSAHESVLSQHAATTAAITSSTAAAREQLQTELTNALQAIDAKETAQLAVIEAKYRDGDERFRAAGRSVGAEAVRRGDQMATEYMRGLVDEDDSWLDGPLTYNRGKARADTAHEISKAYQSGLQDEANKQADQAQQGKARDIESVHATANHARDSLRQQHAATLTTIGDAQSTALRQADDARTSLTDSIAQAVAGGHQVLDQQEVSLTENVRAGARAQAATVEQQASELTAAIQDQISAAVASLLDVGASLSAQVQGAAPPAPEELRSALAQASAQLDTGVGGIQIQIEQGQAQGEERLVQAGHTVTDGLGTSTQTGLDGANSGAADVNSSIASIATSATSAFQGIQDGHDSTLAETTTAATGGFSQAVAGVRQSYDEHARGLEQGFARSAAGLEQGLRGALAKMEGEIRTKAEENAAAVPPRWKSVVKWILIIAVVVVVALVIGPFVIGAVGAALGTGAVMTGIIAGAIVGAATSATIQMINNWASNRPLGEGVVKAAVIGAIGGAVGGGFGAYFSSAAQAGTTVVNTAFRQFMANTTINVVTETAINVITTGHFSWEALGMSALSAIAVGGAFHAAGGIKGVQSIQEGAMGAGARFGGAIRPTLPTVGGVNTGETTTSTTQTGADTPESTTTQQGSGTPASGETGPPATTVSDQPAPGAAAAADQAPSPAAADQAPAAPPAADQPPAAASQSADDVADAVAREGRRIRADDVRAQAREIELAQVQEDVESGIRRPTTEMLEEDIGRDTLVDLAEGNIGQGEAGVEVHHKTQLSEAPEWGTDPENLEALGRPAHRRGAHGNDFGEQRGGGVANPEFDEDAGFGPARPRSDGDLSPEEIQAGADREAIDQWREREQYMDDVEGREPPSFENEPPRKGRGGPRLSEDEIAARERAALDRQILAEQERAAAAARARADAMSEDTPAGQRARARADELEAAVEELRQNMAANGGPGPDEGSGGAPPSGGGRGPESGGPGPDQGGAPPSSLGPVEDTAPPTVTPEPPEPDVGLSDRGYRPAPGERSQTREQWQAEQSRIRAERSLANVDQPLENPLPNAATEGHGHGRHGYQTTDAEQATRVATGIAPDGLAAPAGRASRFRTPQAEAEALGRGRGALEGELQAGNVTTYPDPVTGQPGYVDPATGAPVRRTVVVETNDPQGFGESVQVARRVGGPSSPYVLDASGNRIPDLVVAPQMHARIVFEYVPSANEWRPVTYFPEP